MKYFNDEQLAKLSECYANGDISFYQEILKYFDINKVKQDADERYAINDLIGLNSLLSGCENGYYNGILSVDTQNSIESVYLAIKSDIIDYLDIPDIVVDGDAHTVNEIKGHEQEPEIDM